MQLTTVESDVIHAVGYDATLHLLEIIFNDGRIYQYREVPREVYAGIMSAASKGAYFHENIRDEFQYWELDAETARFVRARERESKTESHTPKAD